MSVYRHQPKMPPESRPRPRNILSRLTRRLFGQGDGTTGPYGGPDLPTTVTRQDGSVVVTIPRRMLEGPGESTGPTVPSGPEVDVTGDRDTVVVTVPNRMIGGDSFVLQFPGGGLIQVKPDTGTVGPITPDDLPPTTQAGVGAGGWTAPAAHIPWGRGFGGYETGGHGYGYGYYPFPYPGGAAPRPAGPGYDPRVASNVIPVPIAPDDINPPGGAPGGGPIDPGRPSK